MRCWFRWYAISQQVQIKKIGFYCVIDIFSKYAGAVPSEDKKGMTIVNAFQKIFDNSMRKPNKIWIDKGSQLQ